MKKYLNPLALTRKLIAFDTINPPGKERRCATYLGGLLEGFGFQVAYYEFGEERTSLIATMKGSGRRLPICFTGHLDTVPLGASPWSRDPFRGETEVDKIWGRGSSDMKGGLAAIVLTAQRLSRYSNSEADLIVVFTAGEETCCEGAIHLVNFGDVLGRAGALVVGEPTFNYPWIGHKGSIRVEIRTRGVSAHASMPEQGVNAIYKAAKIITLLQEFDFDVTPHPFLGAPTLNVGTIMGGTNINSVPDLTTIGLDIRTIPGQDHVDIQQRLQSHLGGDVEIKLLDEAGSVATDHDQEWVQEVYDIMTSFLGSPPRPAGATYFTDASFLTPAYGKPPTIILGPGTPDMAHKTDEFCLISKIKEAIEAYTEIAKRWCGL